MNGVFNMHVMAVDGSKTTVEKFCIPQDGRENKHKDEEQMQTLR